MPPQLTRPKSRKTPYERKEVSPVRDIYEEANTAQFIDPAVIASIMSGKRSATTVEPAGVSTIVDPLRELSLSTARASKEPRPRQRKEPRARPPLRPQSTKTEKLNDVRPVKRHILAELQVFDPAAPPSQQPQPSSPPEGGSEPTHMPLLFQEASLACQDLSELKASYRSVLAREVVDLGVLQILEGSITSRQSYNQFLFRQLERCRNNLVGELATSVGLIAETLHRES